MRLKQLRFKFWKIIIHPISCCSAEEIILLYYRVYTCNLTTTMKNVFWKHEKLYSLRMGVLYINICMFFPLITQTLLVQWSTQVTLLLQNLPWLLYFIVLPPILELIDSKYFVIQIYIYSVVNCFSFDSCYVMFSHLNSVLSVFNK